MRTMDVMSGRRVHRRRIPFMNVNDIEDAGYIYLHSVIAVECGRPGVRRVLYYGGGEIMRRCIVRTAFGSCGRTAQERIEP